jgi:hypothetical protein
MFFLENTWTIFDPKTSLKSAWHWLLILLKAFLLKLPFLSRNYYYYYYLLSTADDNFYTKQIIIYNHQPGD